MLHASAYTFAASENQVQRVHYTKEPKRAPQ